MLFSHVRFLLGNYDEKKADNITQHMLAHNKQSSHSQLSDGWKLDTYNNKSNNWFSRLCYDCIILMIGSNEKWNSRLWIALTINFGRLKSTDRNELNRNWDVLLLFIRTALLIRINEKLTFIARRTTTRISKRA